MDNRNGQVFRAYYVFCFCAGLTGLPIYMTFSVTFSNNDIASSVLAGRFMILILSALSLIPLIRVRFLREEAGWKVTLIALFWLHLAIWGVGHLTLKTLWPFYMENLAGVWDQPERWFGPILLIPAIVLAGWSDARLRKKSSS